MTLLIASLFCFAALFAEDVYTVSSANRLNVRQAPTTSATLVTQLQPGSSVTVLSIDGNWAKVRLQNGHSGYVSTKYISYSHTVNPVARTMSQQKHYANNDLIAGIDLRHSSPHRLGHILVCGVSGLHCRLLLPQLWVR